MHFPQVAEMSLEACKVAIPKDCMFKEIELSPDVGWTSRRWASRQNTTPLSVISKTKAQFRPLGHWVFDDCALVNHHHSLVSLQEFRCDTDSFVRCTQRFNVQYEDARARCTRIHDSVSNYSIRLELTSSILMATIAFVPDFLPHPFLKFTWIVFILARPVGID